MPQSQITTCGLVATLVTVSLPYWIGVWTLDTRLLNNLVEGPFITVCFLAGLRYLSREFINCNAVVDSAYLLRLGICLAWLGQGTWRVSALFYSLGPVASIVQQRDFVRGYVILLMTIGGLLHFIATDMEGARPRLRSTLIAAATVGVGAGVSVWLRR